VRQRLALRAHLVQHRWHTGQGHLPSGLGSGEASADDVDGVIGHQGKIVLFLRKLNGRNSEWASNHEKK
jgi:hypothetical protein